MSLNNTFLTDEHLDDLLALMVEIEQNEGVDRCYALRSAAHQFNALRQYALAWDEEAYARGIQAALENRIPV